ncbi:MAG: hypothetical protein KA189_03795 [Thermoanaerobaculia bacterium]|nr:hypothetical protein [Thermoanaerobaculia bacterium]MDI9630495.1 hypothetical protein [Acidobacteriota bacterium]MBP7812716.1 hypothetical protein [Thermoanaerobaculia bacterium]MBP8844204.1 hypothetical protein [Thermoanaerobaculia bacterium]HRR12952.1 hypothetical protein [Thermoanaerobaculia bacterium]
MVRLLENQLFERPGRAGEADEAGETERFGGEGDPRQEVPAEAVAEDEDSPQWSCPGFVDSYALVSGGVQDAEVTSAVPSGVSGPDGRSGSVRA